MDPSPLECRKLPLASTQARRKPREADLPLCNLGSRAAYHQRRTGSARLAPWRTCRAIRSFHSSILKSLILAVSTHYHCDDVSHDLFTWVSASAMSDVRAD